MAIYRSSDSLSRCDPSLYSNIYDVRKRSDLKPASVAATQPIHKDSIEISRDKIKEEALSRLRHTSKYVIAQNGFMRIGKYLFLAVAFPPYFALYGLPKWILVEGLPTIFSMVGWMWKKVKGQTEKHIEAGTHKCVAMMQFMQNVAHALMQPMVHIALEIQRKMRQMRDNALQFFKHRMRQANAFFLTPYFKTVEKFKHVFQRFAQVREKLSTHTQVLMTRMQEGMQWIKDSPQIFLGWGQAQIQFFNQHAVSWGTQWKARWQNSQQWAQHATEGVFQGCKSGIESLKRHFAPVIHVLQELQLRWQKLSKSCKGKWQQTRDFFQQRHQRALIFLQRQQERIKLASAQRLIHYFMSHPWMGKLPSRLQIWLRALLAHSVVHAICHTAIQVYAFLARGCLKMATYGLNLVAQLTVLCLKIGNAVRSIVKIAGQYFVNSIRMGRRILRQFLYYFLLFMMIIGILVVYSCRLLKDFMNALTAYFPLKKRLQ